MLYLLTPTGGRPEGLALLAGYINDQTYSGPARWIIVDDCDPATPHPAVRESIDVEVVRPAWRWEAGMNTQAASILAGLERVPACATVLVLEDDDAYLPEYFVTMLGALRLASLVGERVARYYNVATRRHRRIPSGRHASLAATVLAGAAVDALVETCRSGSDHIDLRLWDSFGDRLLLDNENVVGIKGLPGRAGIGIGHRSDFGAPDPDGQILAEWLGTARAAAYEAFRRDL